MKKVAFLLFSLALVLSSSCGDSKTSNTKAGANAEVKKGVVPVPDAEVAVIEMENSAAYGTIKLELYSNVAPKMVARFKELAKEGVYNGVTFHRINESVIQSGDPLSKDANPSNDGTGKFLALDRIRGADDYWLRIEIPPELAAQIRPRLQAPEPRQTAAKLAPERVHVPVRT